MARSRKSVDALIGAALAAPGARDGDGPLAVAFSGGLDSTVLLHAAACRKSVLCIQSPEPNDDRT